MVTGGYMILKLEIKNQSIVYQGKRYFKCGGTLTDSLIRFIEREISIIKVGNISIKVVEISKNTSLIEVINTFKKFNVHIIPTYSRDIMDGFEIIMD